VIDVTEHGFRVIDIAPGITREELIAATAADLEFAA